MDCPICKKRVNEPREGEKSYYPFCSERCKLIDLGRWLSGKYQVRVAPDDEAHDGDALDADPGGKSSKRPPRSNSSHPPPRD